MYNWSLLHRVCPRNAVAIYEFAIARHLLQFEFGGTDPLLEPECVS